MAVGYDHPPEVEAALIARARAGDRGAFDALVQGLQPLLASVARRRLPREDDVDDVLQQTLLKAWTQLGTFEGRSSFRSWIARIAVYTSLNYVRRQRSFEPVALEEVPAFTTALNTARLAAGQLWDRLGGYLAALPEKQRLVLELRLFHELEFEEIGALVDCTASAARGHFHQGLKAVRAAAGDLAPGR